MKIATCRFVASAFREADEPRDPGPHVAFLGRIPGLRHMPLPALGLPLLSDDAATNVKLAGHAAAEDLRGRPQAFRAALRDIGEIMRMIANSGAPAGRGYVIHSARDHLGDAQTMLKTVAQMQAKSGAVLLDLLPGRDHVFEEMAGKQRRILKGVKFVGGEK